MGGNLGADAAAGPVGLTVSSWRDLAAIAKWRDHAAHRAAQDQGRSRWYRCYTLRVARVERQRTFTGRDEAMTAKPRIEIDIIGPAVARAFDIVGRRAAAGGAVRRPRARAAAMAPRLHSAPIPV